MPDSEQRLARERIRRPCASTVSRQVGTADDRGQAIELRARMIIDDDLSPFGVAGSDNDGRAEPTVKVPFKVQDMWGLQAGVVRRVFADPGASNAWLACGDERLGLANGEMFLDDSRQCRKSAFCVRQAEQSTSMPLGDHALANGVNHGFWQFKQTDQIRDGRPIQTQAAGELLLSTAIAIQIVPERRILVDRVQVIALEVLHHGELENPLIIESQDSRGNLVKLSLNTRSKTSLAGYELIAVSRGADQDRLQHSMLTQRVSQGGNFLGVEVPPRLKRIGIDLINGDLDELTRLERTGLEAPLFATEQRFQSASQTSPIHGR